MSASDIRFSIQLPYTPTSSAWVEKVQRAERLGFYSISVPDHIGPSLPQLAPLISLAAAAMVTTDIRLAITVLNNDFRNPTILAKEIATLDVLSNGRVDMGIGAGWLEEDLTKTGITSWDPPGTRVSRLFESIETVRALFTGEAVTIDGAYYKITDFVSVPTPLQDPLPIMMGGTGKRLLTYAAKHAQIVSVLSPRISAGEQMQAFEEQLGWIREAGGYEREDLMLGVRVPLGNIGEPGEDRLVVAEKTVSAYPGMAQSFEASELLESPFCMVGSPEDVVKHVRMINERFGITYFTVSEPYAWDLGPVIEELATQLP